MSPPAAAPPADREVVRPVLGVRPRRTRWSRPRIVGTGPVEQAVVRRVVGGMSKERISCKAGIRLPSKDKTRPFGLRGSGPRRGDPHRDGATQKPKRGPSLAGDTSSVSFRGTLRARNGLFRPDLERQPAGHSGLRTVRALRRPGDRTLPPRRGAVPLLAWAEVADGALGVATAGTAAIKASMTERIKGASKRRARDGIEGSLRSGERHEAHRTIPSRT